MTMTTDPIIDELHAVRERMLADAGGTLAALAAKIEADQAKSGRVFRKAAENHAMQVRTGNGLKTSGCDSRLGKC